MKSYSCKKVDNGHAVQTYNISLKYFIYIECHIFFISVGPLDVKIVGANQPLSAGRRYDLLCQSSGSRPPASITWWKNGQRFERTKETVNFPFRFEIFL